MSNDGTPPPFDFQGLFKQIADSARDVKSQVDAAQARMKDIRVEGQAGGGLVVATVNGTARLERIRIDKQAVDPRDVEMLEDLVVAAVNDALSRAQSQIEGELGKATSGFDMGALGQLFGKPR
jgi:DNA-binding YbaB/EbfC family protein